jgi:hypothetical protein
MENLVVDKKVHDLWESVVTTCNKVLHHANFYGFQLMSLPNPNIHEIAKLFDTIVIPLLDDLARNYDFSPESGMKMANIRTYALHLRAITIAINEDNKADFDNNVSLLMSESMLY